MPLRKRLSSFILVIISTIIALLILEIGLRIFFPQEELIRLTDPTLQWFEPSAEYGFLNKKNFTVDYPFTGYDFIMHVQTNSFGHRYKEYNVAEFKDKRYKKVLLLGDSFMFGFGVNMEDHMATHLDNLLNDNHDSFTIINSGVDNWSTIQEVTYAKDHFQVFNPDYIVLLFCGNDPDGDDNFLAYKNGNEDKGTIRFPGKIFLKNHSHLYRFIYYRYVILRHNIKIKAKLKEDENLTLDKQSGYVITPEQWEKTYKIIKDFHADFLKFNEKGVVLILATAPWDNEQRQKLKALSNGKNLFYIDLYDETIDLPVEKTRLKHDGHWSELIHLMSARKLANKILELNDQ
jgi:hypothetical protein